MKPGKYNIKFYRKETFDVSVVYKIDSVAVDLSGYTADMQVRPSAGSGTLIVELTTENGRIAVNTVVGQIELMLTSAETEALPLGQYVYDLNITSPAGVVTKLMRGAFVVLDPVTE